MKKEQFNAAAYLNQVAKDYLDRKEDCFDEIIDFIKNVDPSKKSAAQIRDDIYFIFKKHGFIK